MSKFVPKHMEPERYESIHTKVVEILNDPDAPKVNVKVEGEIDRDKQIEYTKDLFEGQAKNSNKIATDNYNEKPDQWFESTNNRSRLVIIEATLENVAQVAQAMMTASPSDRVMLTGVNSEIQEHLAAHVKNIWINKFNESSDEFKTRFLEHFADEENGLRDTIMGPDSTLSLQNFLTAAPLDKLLGPHQFIPDLNISEENLKRVLPQYKTNVEEMIVCGESSELVNQLPALSQSMKNAPYMAIKASPFTDDDQDNLWTFAFKEGQDFLESLKSITSAKSAPEILGERNDDLTSYENIDLSPEFLSAFNLNNILQRMQNEGKNYETIDAVREKGQEALDYLKTILVEEAIYPGGTSPEEITKTISKATSGLGAKGAKAVGAALYWNLVNRPVSTAKGVEFAVGSMTLDGGNDLIKEALDKKTAYKEHYIKLLSGFMVEGCSVHEAQSKAAAELVEDFIAVELTDKNILKLTKEADEFRDYGLEHSNLVKETNTRGVNWLRPLPYIFGIGGLLQGTGIGLAIASSLGAKIATEVGLGLATGGGFLFGSSTGVTYKSMAEQYQANFVHLPLANKAFALANSKFYDVKQSRTSLLHQREALTLGESNNQDFDHIPDLVPAEEPSSSLDVPYGDYHQVDTSTGSEKQVFKTGEEEMQLFDQRFSEFSKQKGDGSHRRGRRDRTDRSKSPSTRKMNF